MESRPPTPEQLRQDESVPWQEVTAVTVAAYAMLWTAALQAQAGGASFQGLRPYKWRRDRRLDGKAPTTGDLLRLLRYETWAGVLRPGTFHHFVTDAPPAHESAETHA